MERGWSPNHVDTTCPNCPRCGSCNTKFCYYNNYSLTQPRYFCKGCGRYWTKGGSLRNVPVGGGCRRSRRGKSIRLSSDRDLSRVFPYDYNRLIDSASSSHCRVFKNDHFTFSASKPETSNVSAAGSIDIAQVYANFLNHRPAEQEASVEMTELPQCGSARDQYPSLISQQFASVSNYMHMEFSSTDHDHLIPLENSLVEYYPYNNGGFDSLIHKQQENYGLPPWIGEMMDPNHILNAPQMPEAAGAVGIEQGSAQNSDFFIRNNYGNSVFTSTSRYGTLFGPQ
ncbi:hypothetical protein RHMOL_Rhmol03G0071000 [Rhododendron molle]|uniref:Uncharacterized protein n=1 Tax=Rhododendron molle TaxID=49168 RepID=A0ACC0PCM9_RHOML|nr:hypothetical protein RHMOL_Rhmol03G0071000 [Rhododendron molle]